MRPMPEATLVNEVFEETDLREALQILGTASGIRIIVDEQIGGVTSAQLNNVTIEEH